MSPRPTRRTYLAGLSLTAVALAGCTNSGGTKPTETQTTTRTTTTASTQTTTRTTTESESSPAETPAAAIRQYYAATGEDPAAARTYFHPIHPFSPEHLTAEKARNLFGNADRPESISIDTTYRDLSAATILDQSFLGQTDLETSDVAAAIDGEQTAVATLHITRSDGDSETTRAVLVTDDGGWVILAQAFQPTRTIADTGAFETHVVDTLSFDTDANTARVTFVTGPVADRVTATAVERTSSQSTTSPGAIEYFEINVDPAGDTVVVTATHDGETREIRRAQYPPSSALVDDIVYDDDPESDARDTSARVLFNDTIDWAGTVTVEATVSGYEATLDSESNGVESVVAGIDPRGDELVVSRTRDGETTVVHRERYYP